jgi:hypothetical protein
MGEGEVEQPGHLHPHGMHAEEGEIGRGEVGVVDGVRERQQLDFVAQVRLEVRERVALTPVQAGMIFEALGRVVGVAAVGAQVTCIL